jgi:ADP-ribose pyrophosphatase YjhB (NUDIX family)/catechol 2,3-dioxygenase-like lactoylglutathione lyase family enzyme
VTDPLIGYVRVKVVCVFSNDERILAIDAFDPTKKQHYWVPVGGRVEFGETSREAIEREVREELSSEVEDLKLLGVLENMFTYNEAQGHEIVFVYDGELGERSLYKEPSVRVVEGDGQEFTAYWIDPVNPAKGWPVYPNGLTSLLREAHPTELQRLSTGRTETGVSTISGLHHVQLAMPAGGEAEAEVFYTGLLGIPRVAKPAHLEARGGCWFEDENVKIHLGVESEFKPARKAHPALVVDDLEALRDLLEGAGVEAVEDQPLPGFDRFYVFDPFGNRLEFLQPKPPATKD